VTTERCKHCGMLCQDGCREALEVRLTTATDLLAELVAYVDQAEVTPELLQGRLGHAFLRDLVGRVRPTIDPALVKDVARLVDAPPAPVAPATPEAAWRSPVLSDYGNSRLCAKCSALAPFGQLCDACSSKDSLARADEALKKIQKDKAELDAAWEATGNAHRTVRGMGVALAEVIEDVITDRNELRERVFDLEGREARLKDALARWSRGEVVADKLGEPVKLNGAPEIKTEGAEAEVTLRMTLSQAAKLGIFTWLQEKGYGPR
jgi:hypothetical protein